LAQFERLKRWPASPTTLDMLSIGRRGKRWCFQGCHSCTYFLLAKRQNFGEDDTLCTAVI
jgi:hypothetical protein